MSHSHNSGTMHQRQLLREEYNGRQGQTRAMRADIGARRAIAEALDEMAEDADPFHELDAPWDNYATLSDCF